MEQDIYLDAQMVLSCMRKGIDGLLEFAFARRHLFPTPDHAMARAEWLKKQDSDYIQKVSERAAELESQAA